MSWWGKVVGGAFGFMLGGPLGALLGAALGHNFDRGLKGLDDDPAWAEGAQERVQTAFFTATFSVMGHLAKADGQVSKQEIRLAERVMTRMQLSSTLRKAAIDLFNKGKAADFPLDDVLEQFRRETHRRRNLIRMFLEIQIQAALADGEVHTAERQLLIRIGQSLGFGPAEIDQLIRMLQAGQASAEGQHVPDINDAYATLNVDASASDAEVKKAYRRLMSQHHPDKLVSKGLPEEMIKVATEKTHQIRKAYEQIKDKRGF